jgi:hypothetical protein
MVAKLGENKSSVRVYGFSEETVIPDHLRVVGFNDAFPGSVIGMDGQFPQNDQPAASLCPPCVVGQVLIRESPLLAEVCSVGEKADAIGKDGLS